MNSYEAAYAIFVVAREQYIAGNLTRSAATDIVTFAFGKTGYRVVGITPAALGAYASNDFRKTSGIQRAHLHGRAETFEHLCKRPKVPSKRTFIDFWTEHDVTVLALNRENKTIAESNWIPIDNPTGALWPHGGLTFGFAAFREGEVLKQLEAKHLNIRTSEHLKGTNMTNYAKTPQALKQGSEMLAMCKLLQGKGLTIEALKKRLNKSKGAVTGLFGDLRMKGYAIEKYKNDEGVWVYYTEQAPV